METQDFPLHKAAKSSLVIVAVLLIVLVVTIPFSVYLFWRLGRAKVSVSSSGVRVEGPMASDSFELDDVERFGLLKVPVHAGGAGGALARAKLGGLDYGLNVVVKTRSGKTKKFVANQFERHDELVALLQRSIRAPCEELTLGLMGPKWPEAQKAA